MAERRPVDLESALVELARQIDYPSTPDLAHRVRVTLNGARPTSWVFLATPRRAMLAALTLVVFVLAGVLAVSPQARTAVAERLGLRGSPVEQVSQLPSVETAARLDLGEQTTLASARDRLPLLVPSGTDLGDPDAVYVAPTALGGTVTLVYGSRPGLAPAPETGVSLLLLESRLPPDGFQPGVLRKSAGPQTSLQEVSVNGGRGMWMEGAPHVLFLPDSTGAFRQDGARLAANVLLWEQAGLLLRLEGTISSDQALHIAASVH